MIFADEKYRFIKLCPTIYILYIGRNKIVDVNHVPSIGCTLKWHRISSIWVFATGKNMKKVKKSKKYFFLNAAMVKFGSKK